MAVERDIEERLIEKCYWSDGPLETKCLLFTGQLDQGGYGRIKWKGGPWQAHRVAYLLWVGKIPEGLYILHRCDVCRCVAPDHLYADTHQQNMQDMIDRGRQKTIPAIGEQNPNAVLDEIKAGEIKYLSAEGYSQREIARMYDISKTQVSKIVSGKNWPWVKPKEPEWPTPIEPTPGSRRRM